jgi:hypothetical protein
MNSNGGGPKWENWLMLSLLAGTATFYFLNLKKPSQEITYMDFVQNYLANNQVEMITLCEDKSGSSFKYRANIQLLSGETCHLVLPQVENFLFKLDLA